MKLYNTLTQTKEEFVPIVPGEIKMYACGPDFADVNGFVAKTPLATAFLK